MRPMGNGTTPAKNGKAAKAGKTTGVRKSLVKAKVSAVKTTRRLASRGHLKGEVDNLLEHSVVASPAVKKARSPRKSVAATNGNGASTSNGATGAMKKAMSSSNFKKQMKKLAGSNGAASASVESPRRSSRKTRASAATPNFEKKNLSPMDLSVEMAEEATEGADAVDGKSFSMMRSISNLILPSNRYAQVGEDDAKAKQKADAEAKERAKAKEAEAKATEEDKSSCVIS